MLANILFCLALAVGIWITSIIACKMIRGEPIYWWHFVLFAINWTAVITNCIDIW